MTHRLQYVNNKKIKNPEFKRGLSPFVTNVGGVNLPFYSHGNLVLSSMADWLANDNLVFYAIKQLCGNRSVEISTSTIQEATGLSRPTVINSRRRLRDVGALAWTTREVASHYHHRTHFRYSINPVFYRKEIAQSLNDYLWDITCKIRQLGKKHTHRKKSHLIWPLPDLGNLPAVSFTRYSKTIGIDIFNNKRSKELLKVESEATRLRKILEKEALQKRKMTMKLITEYEFPAYLRCFAAAFNFTPRALAELAPYPQRVLSKTYEKCVKKSRLDNPWGYVKIVAAALLTEMQLEVDVELYAFLKGEYAIPVEMQYISSSPQEIKFKAATTAQRSTPPQHEGWRDRTRENWQLVGRPAQEAEKLFERLRAMDPMEAVLLMHNSEVYKTKHLLVDEWPDDLQHMLDTMRELSPESLKVT